MPISITSKQDKFRRCGVVHSRTETVYPDDKFSSEELATLKAEPMLSVKQTKKPRGQNEKTGRK